MSPAPRVSVVIPAYNHGAYILTTIHSVLAQSYTDYEIVVVNDGSPDDTADVLRPLAESGRIRYFEQPNAGQGAARNRGIAEARGQFVALLDDDDLWTSDKLAWQVEEMDAHPDAVLVYGDWSRLEPDGTVSAHVPEPCPTGRVYDAFRQQCWILSPGQALIRTPALRAVNGFDAAIWGSDDWDLYLRLARGGEFVHRPRVCLHYRVHAANASKRAVAHARNHMKVVRRHIGLNLPLLVRHQRAAARYFVPNLLSYAHSSRRTGAHREALLAYAYALSFRPSLLLRRTFIAGVAGTILGRRPG